MAIKALGKLKPFNTIGEEEKRNVLDALKAPLSGYIGGDPRGGFYCNKLERAWEAEFEVGYAVACNSATSGLLAALMACDVGFGDPVWVTDYSMSATAACAHILGAQLTFIDIDADSYNLRPNALDCISGEYPKALIVTNLFGYPAKLRKIKLWCEKHRVWMIEDNAQAPFASENGYYAGTVGDLGVFSLNIHKHIQAGEGGVVVAHESDLANGVRDAINHGELRSGRGLTGLNLRMTETTAAIACAQLKKARWIVSGRIDIAHTLNAALAGHPALFVPVEDDNKEHVYYLWALRAASPFVRYKAMDMFARYKFPMRAGYAPPLHTIFPHSGANCPVTKAVDETIMVYENCAYTPNKRQLKQMCDILKRAGDAVA